MGVGFELPLWLEERGASERANVAANTRPTNAERYKVEPWPTASLFLGTCLEETDAGPLDRGAATVSTAYSCVGFGGGDL